jgi:hypothetical protein
VGCGSGANGLLAARITAMWWRSTSTRWRGGDRSERGATAYEDAKIAL